MNISIFKILSIILCVKKNLSIPHAYKTPIGIVHVFFEHLVDANTKFAWNKEVFRQLNPNLQNFK